MRPWPRAALQLLGALGLVAAAACGADPDRVIVAAGTTIVDSGFVGRVLDRYEAAAGVEVSIVAGSSAQVLDLLSQDAADVAISHAPQLEADHLAAHPADQPVPLFTSRFVIVGPRDLVAAVGGFEPVAAWAALWDSGATFVTRNDGSGTHAREIALWQAVGIDPAGDRYVRTGQGMGFTLQVANQFQGITLAEIGAFLAARPNLSTMEAAALAPSELLENPYVGIAAADSAGAAVLDWLSSPAGAAAIAEANDALFGESVYSP